MEHPQCTLAGGLAAVYGTAFELTPQEGGGWTETTLHSFGNGTDGQIPFAGLIFDAAGNLYGTTYQGGTYSYGTVFELSPSQGGGWTETVLHNFGNGTDGIGLEGGLIFNGAGHLYGTTALGGTYDGGTVFELSPSQGGGWTEQVPLSFGNGTDGTLPYSSLIFDGAGNLYEGGTNRVGTVFEFTPGGPAVALSPISLDFGPQGDQRPTTPQVVTLTNTGDEGLVITSIAITGANSGDFDQTNNCPISPNNLAPGDHCNITVVFSPTEMGTLSADVTITDNAPDSP